MASNQGKTESEGSASRQNICYSNECQQLFGIDGMLTHLVHWACLLGSNGVEREDETQEPKMSVCAEYVYRVLL